MLRDETRIERTFVLIKPDGVQRGLIGETIRRFERKGLKILAIRMVKMEREIAERLYDIHLGKTFYENLVQFVCSAPVVAMVLEGAHAVEAVRQLIGDTRAFVARPGSIRGAFGLSLLKNIVHSSDSETRAQIEMSIFFNAEELQYYKRLGDEFTF